MTQTEFAPLGQHPVHWLCPYTVTNAYTGDAVGHRMSFLAADRLAGRDAANLRVEHTGIGRGYQYRIPAIGLTFGCVVGQILGLLLG